MLPAGKSTPATLSAYDVYMEFITVDSSGEVDVSGVFTRNCFQRWVSTRLGGIKHPEQTFYRTFIAHLRARDARKPFPANIEAKFLEMLRNKDNNVWEACFDNSERFNIGKYGFKKLGFHEAKNNLSAENNQIQKLGNLKIAKGSKNKGRGKRRLQKRSNNIENMSKVVSSDKSEISEPMQEASGLDFNELLNDIAYGHGPEAATRQLQFRRVISVNENNRMMAEYSMVAKSFATLQNVPFVEADVYQDQFPSPIVPWEGLCGMLEAMNDQGYTAMLNSSPCPHCKIVPFSPALIYLLQLPIDPSSPRFNYNVLFPPISEELCFRKDQPIDWCMLEDNDVVVKDCSSNLTSACGNNVTVGNCYHPMIGSFYEFWYAHIRLMPILVQGKTVIKRCVFKKADGSLGLFITRTRATSEYGKLPVTEYQEITDPQLTKDLIQRYLI